MGNRMAQKHLLIGIITILFLVIPGFLFGQNNADPFASIGSTTSGTRTYQSEGAVLALTVYGDDHKILDRQSVIKLENKGTQTTVWQTTTDTSEAYFVDLVVGQYDIEVSAVGYLTVHKPYSITSSYNTFHSEITLQRDPSAVHLSAPNSPTMPAKARKQTQRGVRALKAGKLKDAQKQLEQAYKVAPENADLNFLLGYVYFQNKEYAQAQSFLAKAVTADHRNVQALTLLGRVRLQRGEIDAARATLEEAVAADPDYWMAHSLLADAYLKSRAYEKSREQALIAIDRSKGGGNSVQLVLGQALANLGRREDAIAALDAFLSNAPESPLAPQVKDYIAKLKNLASSPIPSQPQMPVPAGLSVDDTQFRLSIKTWEPPGIDDAKPRVSAGVTCPQGLVISQAGAGVKELVGDISKFAAVEELVHENVDELGNPITKETKHYNYLAAISENKPGYLEVEEYRTEHSEIPQFPDNMVSKGFSTLAFVFHPAMWDNFEFSCEGMGELHGHPTWLVHFRQRDDRPNRIHDLKIGGMYYSINLKGRAWITPDKFQIVRIESELVRPMPEIQLLTEHQIVEYGPVHFGKKNLELWLPKSAELYFDFRKRRIYRKHSFDHFMLFSTDTEEKVGGPKQDPSVPATAPQANP